MRRFGAWALNTMILCGCTRTPTRGGGSSATFEGDLKIAVAIGDEAASDPVLFEVKGSRARWDMLPTVGEAAGYRIYDGSARRLFTVLPDQRLVYVDDLGVTDGDPSVSGDTWSFAPLGVGKVGDQACDRFHVTRSATEAFDLCATTAITPLPLTRAFPSLAMRAPFLTTLEAQGRLLLAASGASRSGARASKPFLNAISIVPAPIDDARFAVPDFPVAGPSHFGMPARR